MERGRALLKKYMKDALDQTGMENIIPNRMTLTNIWKNEMKGYRNICIQIKYSRKKFVKPYLRPDEFIVYEYNPLLFYDTSI